MQLTRQNDELEATQADLAAERERWQKLFDLAPDALIVTNKAGLILEFNRRAKDLLGLQPAQGSSEAPDPQVRPERPPGAPAHAA